MPEQILKSPGYYDREIDLSARQTQPSGIPAGVIGAATFGPAFVPVELGSYPDFEARFGPLNPKFVAGYSVIKWLENRNNVWFVRLLGAGANTTIAEFENTRTKGIVRSAGMQITGSTVSATDLRHKGAVQFIAARHKVTGSEAYGYPPMFTDNASIGLSGSFAYLVRASIMTTNDARVMVFDTTETFTGLLDDAATIDDTSTSAVYRKFKVAISSSAGSSWSSDDGFAGVKIFTASLDPSSDDYVGKRLNTDPEKFVDSKHLLYADFAVDAELATVASGSGNSMSVVVLSGSSNASLSSGDSTMTFRDAFGRFDTRYTTPRTPWIISQPFAGVEQNLFYFESISDGEYANCKFKVSIAGIRASTDPRNDFGTFTVVVRAFDDTDYNPKVLEQFNNVNLNPNDDNYIAKIIGDTKFSFNWDSESPDDRRLILTGKNSNKSKLIRVVMNDAVDTGMVSAESLPFGFRGINTLLTNTLLTDTTPTLAMSRLGGSGSFGQQLTGSIVPALPMRFKVTRGEVTASANYTGQSGPTEVVDSRLYWGVKFERTNNVLNSNVSQEANKLVRNLIKFNGIEKLDVTVSGAFADTFNNNKFSLSKVALAELSITAVTVSVAQHMKEAAYIHNVTPDATNYYAADGAYGNRVTFGTLLAKGQPADFNRFSDFMKFTTVFQGGWDGVNILDKNAVAFDDRATSVESSSVGYGGANGSFTSPGATTNVNYSGIGQYNNAVFAYKTAVDMMTDEIRSKINVLDLPGQRDPIVTDYAAQKNKSFDLSFYLMDIPVYDFNDVRIFDGETSRFIDVRKTATRFDQRGIDNDSVAAYFPNVTMDDIVNNKRVTVPGSVAAMAAISFNDKVGYPWFAPAGFNRAALNFVTNTQVRISQPERNTLFDARINPIVKFPNEGYVFFSQTTLKQGKSLLSSINVKRMILEVKRLVAEVGNRLLFEQITPALRQQFVKETSQRLSTVQTNRGLEAFKVICDDSNNTQVDVDANRMNGRIKLIPTTAVEYVLIDFIITAGGNVAFI
jgi:hypothetical protein